LPRASVSLDRRADVPGTPLAFEVPLILLIYYGFARFFENDYVRFGLSIAGGAMIILARCVIVQVRSEVRRKAGIPYNAFVRASCSPA